MGYRDAIIIAYGEAIRLKAKQDLVDKSNRYNESDGTHDQWGFSKIEEVQ